MRKEVKMDTTLSQLANDLLVYFFIIGHSSFNPNINHKEKYNFIVIFRTYFPSFVFLVLVCCNTILSFRNMNFDDVTFDFAIYCLMISSSTLTCILVLAKTPIFGDCSSIVWHKFIQFEKFTEHILQIKFRYDDFHKSYISKVKIIIIFYMLMLLMKFTTRTNFDTLSRHYAMLALNFTSMVTTLNMLFFIHLFGYMTHFVNQNIINNFRNTFLCTLTIEQCQTLTTSMRNIKRIHYKLWEITHLISTNYGWILVSLIVHSINYSVHPMYMFIVNLHETKFTPNKRVLSK